MDFKYKKYIDKYLIYIIFAVLILIFIIGFLFLRSHNEKSKIEDIGRTISEINLTYDLSKEEISSENYLNSVEKKLNSLNQISLEFNSLNPSKKHENIYMPLKKGLNKNIELLNKLLVILKDPDALNLSEEYYLVLKLKKECENYYSLCRSNLIPTYLNKEGHTYIQDILYYINELIKTKRDKDFIQSQKNDFVVSMKTLIFKLSSMKEKLFETAKIIKDSKRDLNVLAKDIEIKRYTLQEIKNTLYGIPIPEKANDAFLSFETSLKSYETYIDHFHKELLKEIEGKSKDTSYYEKSASLFDSFVSSLEKAEDDLEAYNKN